MGIQARQRRASWRRSIPSAPGFAPRPPSLTLVAGSATRTGSGTDAPSPRLRLARLLRPLFDRLLAHASLVPLDPVLDMRLFPWTATLRQDWAAIRDEAHQLAPVLVPGRRHVVPLAAADGQARPALQRCPATAAALAAIPHLESAAFTLLAPGTHLPAHRGPSKALLACHLGLSIPRDGDPRMRIGERVVRWAEGETLVFDDSVEHEAWNDGTTPRILLSLRFRRPLRHPAHRLADPLLRLLR